MAEPLPSAAERPRTVAGGRWLRVAVVASAALTLLELLWEAWLAPLRDEVADAQRGGMTLGLPQALPPRCAWRGTGSAIVSNGCFRKALRPDASR